MATFRFYDGNNGIYRYTNLDGFAQDTISATLWRGEWDGSRGSYDVDQGPFAVEFTISGGELGTAGPGPDEGDTIYTDGTVTAARFYDNVGNLLLEVTGLSLDASQMVEVAQNNETWGWNYFAKGNHTFIGSNDSMNSDGWNGDDITTGWGKDTVNANGGDDYIKDYGGADKYFGGDGYDTLTYDEWYWNGINMKSGITADLSKGTIIGPDGKTDQVSGIEEVRGTFLKDTFIGDKNSNDFFGYNGRDSFNGKGGFDIVNYQNDERQGGDSGVVVNFAAGTVRDGFGRLDTIKSIEGARGTNQDDVFSDNEKDNYFKGFDGDDIYKLSGGNDVINDRNGGADFFQFFGVDFGSDEIQGFDQDGGARDRIYIEGVTGFGQLTISQDGDDAIIQASNGTIRLVDFDSGDLSGSDFVFSLA